MINFDMFLASLPIMLKGMAGVFIVTAIIIVITLIIAHTKTNDEGEEEQD